MRPTIGCGLSTSAPYPTKAERIAERVDLGHGLMQQAIINSAEAEGTHGMRTPVGNMNTKEPLIFVPLLNSMSKSFRGLLGLQLAEIGLDVGQDILLICLARNERTTMQEVVRELEVRSSTISKMTDRLAAKGLVEKMPSTDDRRVVFVKLTPLGTEKCSDIVKVWVGFQESIVQCGFAISQDAMAHHLGQLDAGLRTKLARLR